MKPKNKISGRERWILALGPALAIGFVYFFWFAGDYAAELEKQRQRGIAAVVPLPPPTPSPTLAKARETLAEAKRNIAEREAKIAQYENRLAALPAPNASAPEHDPVRVIEKVEAVFARNGITPVLSEASSDAGADSQPPPTLVAALTPKLETEPGAEKKSARVWHCIFDDSTPHFERALKQFAVEAPSVVPLSLNLVYNPDNDGETRLLELWIAY